MSAKKSSRSARRKIVSRSARKNAPKLSKWVDMYVVQGNYGYGHGWEDESQSLIRSEARADLKSYRENGPGSYRLITRRVLRADVNVAYKPPRR